MPGIDAPSWQALLGGPEPLFDYLPDVYLFVKDDKGRFIGCNQSFVKMLGVGDKRGLLGRSDPDFFPGDLCQTFAEDDAQVLRTGVPIVDKLELVRKGNGDVDWHHTTKLPITNDAGVAVGVAGLTRDLKRMHDRNQRFMFMAPAVDRIINHYGDDLRVTDLARSVGLSISQFERQFKERFGTTPLRYLTQVRVKAAAELLTSTDNPIAEIAQSVGFYDQSHLTHHFVRHQGVTPSKYRRAHQRPVKVAI